MHNFKLVGNGGVHLSKNQVGLNFQKLVGIEIKKVVKSLFEAIPLLGFSCGVGSSEKKKRENGV